VFASTLDNTFLPSIDIVDDGEDPWSPIDGLGQQRQRHNVMFEHAEGKDGYETLPSPISRRSHLQVSKSALTCLQASSTSMHMGMRYSLHPTLIISATCLRAAYWCIHVGPSGRGLFVVIPHIGST
jgi:hypothetical protein